MRSSHSSCREDNRIRRALRNVAFPLQATLENWICRPSVTWIANKLNILVLGPTGGGKSFLVCALGTARLALK